MATKAVAPPVLAPLFTDAGMINMSTNMTTVVTSAMNYELFVFAEGTDSETSREILYKDVIKTLEFNLGSYIDRNAINHPARLHHVYEWERIGEPDARLWALVPRSDGKRLTVGYTFLPSKTYVPIKDELEPGTKHIYANKAGMMESGKPVFVKPLPGNKYIRFIPKSGGIVFSKGVYIRHSGGYQVHEGFQGTFFSYFRTGYGSRVFNASSEKVRISVTRAGRDVPTQVLSAGMASKPNNAELKALAAETLAINFSAEGL
jgi:hypothetical protein